MPVIPKKPLALVAALAIALVGLAASPASAALRQDSTWSESYFTSADGITKLHADVLRPKGLAPTVKTPVVLTVSPYTNHSGQTTDYDPEATGPSSRFYDFLDLSKLLERGYTYVIVDLPGFGGSGGCNDWGGNREQLAVKSAVEWAASQPWSTGKVAMFGKSYDGWTGLMGIAQQPKGLAAVVSIEPVYAGYNYLYNNGVRFSTSLLEGAIFAAVDAKPGSTADSPDYLTNSPPTWCYGVNVALQQQDDPNSAFWRERNLLPAVVGATTPLFLTQGYLEDNTKPDAAYEFFNSMQGPKRAWFGQWDHCRPWETYQSCTAGGNDQRLALGREGFVAEVLRFLDFYVKGLPAKQAPTQKDPPIVVQDSTGRFRTETAWPPSDSAAIWNTLRTDPYTDDGNNSGSASDPGAGVWTFSQPLPNTARLAGEPVLNVRVDAAVPNANLVADVYDVAPNGKATLVSRGAQLLRGQGQQQATLRMYGEDWVIPAGHRIGVLVSGSNSEWWIHVPTNQDVTVLSSKIALPFLKYERTKFLDGAVTPRLDAWVHGDGVTIVPAATVTANQTTFVLPPKLRAR